MRTLLLLLVAVLLVVSRPVRASCAEAMSPQEALQRMEAVFSGHVESTGSYTFIHALLGIRPPPVQLTVLAVWKGALPDSIAIDNMRMTSAEFPFERGQQYLVYAYIDGETGKLATNGCVGTKLLTNARTDLVELGPPTVVLPPADQPSAQWQLPTLLSILVLAAVIMLVVRHRARTT